MSRNFELSSLHDHISRALTLTETVRATLEFECAEARFVLKPWHIKTVVTREIDRNICICNKVSSESQAENISEGIGRTILQAQKLRETLSYNIPKQEKRIKEPNLRNICVSKILQLDKTKSQNVYHKPCQIETSRSIKPKIKPHDNNVKNTKTQNIIKTISILSTTNKTTQVLSKSKKVSDVAVTRVDTKQKGKKNFLITNKLNIKNIKPVKVDKEKKKIEIKKNSSLSHSQRKPVICTASTSELTNLIEKLSSSSFENMSISSINPNCPVHGENVAQFTEETNIQSMSIVDALCKLDIPKDILNVLQMYHSYLECTKKTTNKLQHQKTISFLKEFEKMNENIFVGNTVANLTMQSISVFGKVCNGIIHEEEIKKLEKELESVYKINQINKFNINSIENVKPRKTMLKYSEIAGWMLNGIWNSTCIKDFQGMSKESCISYNNITQLSSLLKILQEFQQTEYFNTMIEILLRDIIPAAELFFKPTDAAYLEIYKMINILSQFLYPKNPIFVKTEE